MISKFKKLISKVIPTPVVEQKVECAIDETVVSCDTLSDVFYSPEAQGTWTGIPAPVYLEDDEWFGPAPAKSEKQLDYMEKEVEIKRQEREENFSVEPDNIHELMYNMATSQQSTTLHLDPPSTPGGSENFQGGDNGYGWMSGTGMGQFT
jgi:hypothetical protein